ncbi:hypothetical protein [Wolbachia endosymbiont (group E) of Neria commutata]|uniref:hypothetical protein n=1 Tax=Wolbachia endosymbiont (group E) of Neria commutata TaxID=3066149 RepID=UPI0031331149
MPGRRDTSGEMERLEAVYKNFDAKFSYIKTDADGLGLNPLEVGDSAEAAKQAKSENEFSLMDRLKGLFS